VSTATAAAAAVAFNSTLQQAAAPPTASIAQHLSTREEAEKLVNQGMAAQNKCQVCPHLLVNVVRAFVLTESIMCFTLLSSAVRSLILLWICTARPLLHNRPGYVVYATDLIDCHAPYIAAVPQPAVAHANPTTHHVDSLSCIDDYSAVGGGWCDAMQCNAMQYECRPFRIAFVV
jgi:hypothetical protein